MPRRTQCEVLAHEALDGVYVAPRLVRWLRTLAMWRLDVGGVPGTKVGTHVRAYATTRQSRSRRRWPRRQILIPSGVLAAGRGGADAGAGQSVCTMSDGPTPGAERVAARHARPKVGVVEAVLGEHAWEETRR